MDNISYASLPEVKNFNLSPPSNKKHEPRRLAALNLSGFFQKFVSKPESSKSDRKDEPTIKDEKPQHSDPLPKQSLKESVKSQSLESVQDLLKKQPTPKTLVKVTNLETVQTITENPLINDLKSGKSQTPKNSPKVSKKEKLSNVKSQSLESVQDLLKKKESSKTLIKATSLEMVHQLRENSPKGSPKSSNSSTPVSSPKISRNEKLNIDLLDENNEVFIAFYEFAKKRKSSENIDFCLAMNAVNLTHPISAETKIQLISIVEKYIMEDKNHPEKIEINISSIRNSIYQSYEKIKTYENINAINSDDLKTLANKLQLAKQEVRDVVDDLFWEFKKDRIV